LGIVAYNPPLILGYNSGGGGGIGGRDSADFEGVGDWGLRVCGLKDWGFGAEAALAEEEDEGNV